MDSERKKYGKDIATMAAKSWLAARSMEAYSLWMAWIYQPDKGKRDALAAMQTEQSKKLVRKAYQMGEDSERKGYSYERY